MRRPRRSLRRAASSWSAARTPSSSSRASSPTTSRRSSRASGCYAALLDRKGHMQADMRVLRLSDQEVWLDTEPGAADVVVRHLSTYKVGRQVEIAQPGSEVAILSLLGPAASAAGRDRPACPRARSPRARGWRGPLPRRRHRPRHRPHLPGQRGGGRRRGAGRCRRRPGLRAGGRDPARRVGTPPLRARDDRRHDPAGGGHRRTRRQLHEGLLHRPGDGRPPALQGKAQSAPARAQARCARHPGRRDRARRPRRGAGRDGRRLPRPRPDRACRDPPGGRARRAGRGRREPASAARWWTCRFERPAAPSG